MKPAQDLTGNACLAFSMSGDFENAAISYGDREYSRAQIRNCNSGTARPKPPCMKTWI